MASHVKVCFSGLHVYMLISCIQDVLCICMSVCLFALFEEMDSVVQVTLTKLCQWEGKITVIRIGCINEQHGAIKSNLRRVQAHPLCISLPNNNK